MARSSPLTIGLARAWFPAALIVLLLLAIPGLVLFVLNLLGLESAVNPWFQEHWHISYHIPIPWWGGLILLLVPILILLLYFLKLKRKPLHVPSTFLWKKSIEDLHVNSLFQWLRENVLLLLQILTVLVLLYALMSFQIHGNMVEGKHYIVMIDNSASMSATDVSPNRLERAKKEALKEIDAHTDNDTGMVLVFNSSAQILQSYTHDRSLLRSAVNSIQATERPTRLEEALSLADSLANPTRSTDDAASRPPGEDPAKARTYVAAEGMPTEVFLFSDGRFPDVPDFNLGNLSVQYRAMGEPGREAADNVGFVTLNAARDDRDPGRLLVFAQVANYRSVESRVQVELELLVNGEVRDIYKPQAADGNDNGTIGARKLIPIDEGKPDGPQRELIQRGTYTFVISDVDDRSDVILHAKLKDNKDKFSLDDEAWLVVGVIRKARVLIVSPGNKLLSAFFDHPATQKVTAVTNLDPATLKDAQKYLNPAREGAWDLVIFDRCAPETEEEMPSANTWFIDEMPPPFKKKKIVEDKANVLNGPLIKGSLEKSPLLRYLTGLHEIGIDSAFRVDPKDLPPRTPRLLESEHDTALLFTLSRQSYTDLVQTFAIMTDDNKFNTNWALLTSFPIFLRNVTYVLGNVSDAAGEETVQPGQVKTLRPDMAVKKIEVFGPVKGGLPDGNSGETLERKGRPDFSFGNTEHVGVYEVRWDGKRQRDFAVNLLDADESNIEPRMQIQIGQDQITAGQSLGTPYDTWKWVALGALGLLLLEWYIYNRRVYI
jgi:von Willebrand factor type A domain/Aerotolerance regulator N-terminal